jgi:hypothetical protein
MPTRRKAREIRGGGCGDHENGVGNLTRAVRRVWIAFGVVLFLFGWANAGEVPQPRLNLMIGFVISIVVPVVGYIVPTRMTSLDPINSLRF